MKTKVILFLSLIMLTFACKNSKNAQKSTEPVKYRVIVSFISKASGTDAQAIAKVDSFITSNEKKYKKTIAYDKVPWGREGEVDYCFTLKGLSKSKQEDFVKGLNNLLKSNANVNIMENTTCPHGK
jgi:hypothetical protein